MSTIEDVAKLAGLSRTTVSRVINNHPYVSDEKKRVQLAMKHLGFVPNSAAGFVNKNGNNCGASSKDYKSFLQ